MIGSAHLKDLGKEVNPLAKIEGVAGRALAQGGGGD